MSFKEVGNLTSYILKFFIQNVLFLTPKIIWISLIQNLILVLFLIIPHLARLIEYIIIEHFVLRNQYMSHLKKLKMIKKFRFKMN